jgi:hypothetical protein
VPAANAALVIKAKTAAPARSDFRLVILYFPPLLEFLV